LKRDNSKGGIGWWIYRNEVLIPLLIPYYEAVQRRHSGKVWIVEDGVGLHNKAWDSSGETGIRKAPWMSNSPDLNQIEPIWGYLKDMLFDLEVSSAAQQVKQLCKARIASGWASQGLKQCAKYHINGYRAKLELVAAHKGKNDFRG
jgi:hypothetical protein